jgi:hypothetical protein
MPVEVRFAHYGLVQVDPAGNVLGDKATLKQRTVSSSEFRVLDNSDGREGGAAAPNSAGFPKLAAYLEAEAADGFAVAVLDQTHIITHMIT